MHTVRADFPIDWPYANIYTLADLHIGDAHCSESEVLARVKAVQDDPYGLCILNGDLMNTALRNSVSDVYGEVLSPMQQIAYLVNMLRPIAGKIIGVTAGNHENRVYKSDGIDVMRLVCREIGIEEKYAPEGVLIFLRFGTRNGHGYHREKKPPPVVQHLRHPRQRRRTQGRRKGDQAGGHELYRGCRHFRTFACTFGHDYEGTILSC